MKAIEIEVAMAISRFGIECSEMRLLLRSASVSRNGTERVIVIGWCGGINWGAFYGLRVYFLRISI